MYLKITELVNNIKEFSQNYYEGNPSITDQEFDSLVAKLRELDPDNDLLNIVAFGYDPEENDALAKYSHKSFVGSLDKVKITDYQPEEGFIAMPKLDGSSAVAYYNENGELTNVLSRGNGYVGLDITHNIHESRIPQKVNPDTGISWVRGEVVMTWHDFYNGEYGSHPRNVATGLSQSKSLPFSRKALLHFVAYDSNLSDDKHLAATFQDLSMEGFSVIENTLDPSLESIEKYSPANYKKYPSDGVVVCHFKNSTATKYAVKFQSESRIVKVEEVVWHQSGYGRLIPVVRIEPTKLSGATIVNCSGFNAKFIKDSGIGVGSLIEICRSNEIIPHIMRVVESTGANIPDEPGLEWEGVHLRREVDFEPLVVNSLINKAAPLGFGQSSLNKFKEVFSINNLGDIKLLSEMSEDRVNQILSKNMGSHVRELSKRVLSKLFQDPWTVYDVLLCSWVDGMGGSNSQTLAKIFPEKDVMLSAIESGGLPEDVRYALSSYIPGKVFNERLELLKKLFSLPLNWKTYEEEAPGTSKFKITLTGKMSAPRSKLLDEWKSFGVTQVDIQDAEYLVCAKKSTSSKFKSAEARGTTIVTEEEFRNILRSA